MSSHCLHVSLGKVRASLRGSSRSVQEGPNVVERFQRSSGIFPGVSEGFGRASEGVSEGLQEGFEALQ